MSTKSARILDTSAEELFERVIKSLNNKLTVERKDSDLGLKLLSQFDQLKEYERLYVHKVTEFRGDSASFIILLAEKHLKVIKQLKSGLRYEEEVEEIEPLLFFTIPQDMGKVLVREETFGDRVANFFNRQDINFEDYPIFSKKYFVVGDNPEKVKTYFPETLMHALEKTEEVMIEINGKLGLARTEKNLNERLLLQLIKLGNQITLP